MQAKTTRTGISFCTGPWHINGVTTPGVGQIIQSYQRVLEFLGDKMHLFRRAVSTVCQGSKMYQPYRLSERRDQTVPCPRTVRGRQTHAKPIPSAVGW
jgi:hypothetical protein